MAENNNNFKSTVEALFQGMDGMISSKTVVGDAIHVGDTIILPLVDVSFGIGAGSFRAEKREKRNGWNRWKDYPECSSCDQEWNDQACKCEKSGYDDKNSGYGTGSGGPFYREKRRQSNRSRCGRDFRFC